MKQIPFKELEKFFEDFVPPDGPVKINQAATIIDGKKFAQSHIDVLKANPGNRRLMPFYERLLTYYYICKKQKNGNK